MPISYGFGTVVCAVVHALGLRTLLPAPRMADGANAPPFSGQPLGGALTSAKSTGRAQC